MTDDLLGTDTTWRHDTTHERWTVAKVINANTVLIERPGNYGTRRATVSIEQLRRDFTPVKPEVD